MRIQNTIYKFLMFAFLCVVLIPTHAQNIDSNFSDVSDWSVSASNNNNVANAFDGDSTTRWTTQRRQRNGEFFEIDFNTVKSFDRIVLDSTQSINDYPRDYTVLVSQDGSSWQSVATGTPGQAGQVLITFDPQSSRFLRIEQNGIAQMYWWSIHELTISLENSLSNEGAENVALNKAAEQSSTDFSGAASRAVDGNTSGNYRNNSTTHTEINEQTPWWQVDLAGQYDVSSIVLHNRTNNCCGFRLADAYVFVSASPFGQRSLSELVADQSIESSFHAGIVGESLEIGFNSAQGRYVRVQLLGEGTLSLAEVEVFAEDDSEPIDNTPVGQVDDAVETDEEAANFLLHATFGPTEDSIDELRELGYSDWFKRQIAYDIEEYVPATIAQEAIGGSNRTGEKYSMNTWFRKASTGEDQLRQVATFALSQIFATDTNTAYIRKSTMHASFKDAIQNNALGNYRELLQDVTYSPLMGNWLTYMGNRKEDPETGSMPDENYARELLQLFTLGVVELQQNGNPVVRAGEEVETYSGTDILGLAKVFTGFYWANRDFDARVGVQVDHDTDIPPMVVHDEYHSTGTKTFLGQTIPEYGDGDQTVEHALDVIFAHDNVAPFISRQLIQRLVTSNPSPSYIESVANAFDAGVYELPDGSEVGSGERGDLVPVWAAILFSPEARDDYRFENTVEGNTFGKVRDPIERFVHWMRVSDVYALDMENIARFANIGILPFRTPSVFNFYRPGYVASNAETGQNGLVAPELQIFNGPNIIQFLNTMNAYIRRDDDDEYFIPAYQREVALANNAQDLVDHLNLVYTANQMSDNTQQDMIETIESISIEGNNAEQADARLRRVHVATLLTIASIEFTVRR